MAMSTKIIAELGSCHMGKFDRIKEAIDKAKELDLYVLKLQLFPNEAKYTAVGNVWLSPELFVKAFDYGKSVGLPVSASVFDYESFLFLANLKPDFIKFSFSMKEATGLINEAWNRGIQSIVSCDVMTDHLVPKESVKLYCIPEYPVRYEVSFEDIFPRFDGFSDHTLGIKQTQRAIDNGAKVIEKHVRLGYEDETCPDAYFAVNINELGRLKR